MVEVRIENLVKKYSSTVTALAGIDLELKAGTMTAVLGPSGCGKTTLLRALGGFLETDSGRIFFGDRDVTRLPPQERGAALVFQNYALWPHMSVYDNIAYGLKIKKVDKKIIKDKIDHIVDLVGLDPGVLEKDRKPSQLSGGQQQRVALARALVVEPQLFLLDEPLSNLDAKVRSKLRVYIREIQKKVGITALYVTHDQEEALSIADKVVVMDKGRIMQLGTPEEIYSNPKNIFVAEFIGDSTILKGTAVSDNEIVFEGNNIKGVEIQSDHIVKCGDAVNIILRSADLKILPHDTDCSGMGDMLCLNAYAEENMFVGSKYKHMIRFGEQIIFADWEKSYRNEKVKLLVPRNKIRIFRCES
jgi:ABC-type Fe3+/spermidine/putrescine transport system ATPase subunit